MICTLHFKLAASVMSHGIERQWFVRRNGLASGFPSRETSSITLLVQGSACSKPWEFVTQYTGTDIARLQHPVVVDK